MRHGAGIDREKRLDCPGREKFARLDNAGRPQGRLFENVTDAVEKADFLFPTPLTLSLSPKGGEGWLALSEVEGVRGCGMRAYDA